MQQASLQASLEVSGSRPRNPTRTREAVRLVADKSDKNDEAKMAAFLKDRGFEVNPHMGKGKGFRFSVRAEGARRMIFDAATHQVTDFVDI